MTDSQFNSILREGLVQGNQYIIGALFGAGVTDIDLSHPSLNPPANCSIF
jgi:hypothetical protein